MDNLTYEILRAAVRVARDEQIRSLTALRNRLDTLFPGATEQREAALKAWANHLRQAHPNGIRSYV